MAKNVTANVPNDDNGSNVGGDETHNTGDVNTIETPPAKPQVGVLIRGSATAIPENLLDRGPKYEWSDMAIGDHKLVAKVEAPQARASAYAYGRAKGKRFASQKHAADANYVEIWRVMDPNPEPVQMQQQQQQANQNEDVNEAAE